ncbi:MAG: Fe-S cluster assembly sulfur transfer protein SufU [Terriglobales bacterium]|jgi:nitrogen fixation protein NifU and related proteins
MADLRDLYQELILEHSKHPRNYHALPGASRKVEGFNPLCGDHFTVYLKLDGDTLTDISFEGAGCAISKSSASVMTQALKGKNKQEAEELFNKFHDLVTGKSQATTEDLGKLAAFSGVSEFPVRVKCAILAWHAVHEALSGKEEAVTTE